MYKHHSIPLQQVESTFEDSLLFDVMFIDQQHGNMCGEACDAMIKQFYHRPFYSNEVNPRGAFEAQSRIGDFESQAVNVATLKEFIKDNGPIALQLPLKHNRNLHHCIVCTGYVDDKIIYHDPLHQGNLCITLAELNRIAHNGKLRAYVSLIAESERLDIMKTKIKNARIHQYQQLQIRHSHAIFFSLSPKTAKHPVECLIDYLHFNIKPTPFRNSTESQQTIINHLIGKLEPLVDMDENDAVNQAMLLIESDLGQLNNSSYDEPLKVMRTFMGK